MNKVALTFDKDVAKEVGTDAAIILQNIQFWVSKNEANGSHFYDGRFWTYNSVKAFEKLFDWLTPKQIKTCLDKLEKHNFVLTGNYNKMQFDRTKWYTSICPNGKMEDTNEENAYSQTVLPIPDISSTDINTDVLFLKEPKYNYASELLKFSFDPQLVKDYCEMRRMKRAPMNKTQLDGLLKECHDNNFSVDDALRICIEKNWQGFRVKWLHNENIRHNGTSSKTNADIFTDAMQSEVGRNFRF